MYPQTNEQKGVAFRVDELGAGLYLTDDTKVGINMAFQEVMQNAEYQKHAGEISDSFAGCGGSKEAVEKIIDAFA
jgi:UDP:flavonoid glycosyltransferase YjiC (YdhE family)